MTRRRRRALLAALLLASAAASGCTAAPPSQPSPSRLPPTAAPAPSGSSTPVAGWWRVSADVATLASGLRAPWSVVPLPDGGALVSQRDDGTVAEVLPDGTVRDVGVVPGVVSGGESGLHGIALRTTGDETLLYAYHGAADDNRVVRMPLLGEPGALTLGGADVILAGIPRANTHDGGRLAFGPDGFLYVTTGDAQNGDAAQDAESLGGKILRLTADGEPAPGNPWGNAAWSMGHRNVQGVAWTADGTMWASEFGQNTWDELNRIEAGGNYGWPVVEGIAGRGGLVDPVIQWSTDEASPSGIAASGDTLFLAGLRGERLWQVDTRDGEAVGSPVAAFVGEQGRLRDAVAAADGSLWVLTNNTDGRGMPRPDDDLLLRVPLDPAA